jgi:hypothetical protein
MTIEAVEKAIDLIELGAVATKDDIVKCLRSAIAEAEKQKPVAFMQDSIELYVKEEKDEKRGYVIPLYDHPQQKREWVGLTDEEQIALLKDSDKKTRHWLVWQVEEKLKEKNT